MIPMTEALMRIDEDFMAFRDAVARCKSASAFQRADLQDAYARLARVRDRYLKERPVLARSEQRALARVFDDDTFFQGMMDLRQVGEHVVKRTGPTVRTIGNAPIDLDCETSARSAFAAPEVTLADTRGESHRIDHLELLQEADRRIQTALRNAQS